MRPAPRNVAYVDGANLYQGAAHMRWKLDYRRFRVWLAEKHGVARAYLFLGMIPRFAPLYKRLQEAGFTLVFKETVRDGDGKPKGNCDADLVLQAVRDVFESEYENAVIVSSDGDFASTVAFLRERGKFGTIVSPHPKDKCSILLKRTGARITYLSDIRPLVETRNEKAPGANGTAQGSFS